MFFFSLRIVQLWDLTPFIVFFCSIASLYQVDYLHDYTHLLEGELRKETDNGRLFRLLCKLGFVNERPEFDGDPGKRLSQSV